MTELFPYVARHRINDLLSNDSSNETKTHTARWFAEMIIKEFLADEFPDDNYKKLSLGELIKLLTGKFDQQIVDALLLLKEFGDKASHYHPDRKISDLETQKAVEAALSLFPLLIIDHLRKHPLDEHRDRFTILSTTLPLVRVMVIESLIDFNAINNEYQYELLHRWCLAQVKAGNRDKARRKLAKLLKSEKIPGSIYAFESASINEIEKRKNEKTLPIPQTQGDFARNFADVVAMLSDESKKENEKLIRLLGGMVKNIDPTEMGSLKGMQLFIV